MLRTKLLSIAIAVSLAFAGCTGEQGEGPEPGAGALPAQIATAEGLAEDIQTSIDSLNWSAAGGKLSQLQSGLPDLEQAVMADGGEDAAQEPPGGDTEAADADTTELASFRDALDSLATQVGRRERLRALESANTLSRLLVLMAGDYAATVPAEVGTLDVAGRDVSYRTEGGRWGEAAASVSELRSSYAAVQTHVSGRDAALDTRVRRTIDGLAGAVAAQKVEQVKTLAAGLLDEVDSIEKLY